jgi:AcrR family transcriptional regulator
MDGMAANERMGPETGHTLPSTIMATSEDSLTAKGADKPTASTARYARKKLAIVAAASEILNRDGVKGMTLANVAASVGLITTSVTYYFKRKEDLAVACFLDGIEQFDELITEALRERDARSRLLRLIDLWLDLNRRIATGETHPVPIFNDIRALQKPQRTLVVETYMRFFAKVRQLFGADEFPWLDEHSRTARAHLIMEQIFWTVAWLPRYDLEDYSRVRDRIFELFVHGLAGEGREWNPVALSLQDILAPTEPQPTPRETFLIAATRLINERGYRGASVEKISARLNVTKGSFYHHNEAKDDLVVECFERSFEAIRRIQRAVIDRAENHWWKLATIAATLMNYQISDRGPLLRTSALSAVPLAIRYEMVSKSNRVSDRFASIISDGIATGCIRAVDPFIAAQMLTITLNASAEITWWIPAVPPAAATELYAKPMLMGIFSP